MQFNGDTGTNYSCTNLYGNGSTAGSNRRTNASNMRLSQENFNADGSITTVIINVLNYANTTTYKSVLSRSNVASQEVNARVNLWRSTAAINSITLFGAAGNYFSAGSVFTLYGILAA